MNTVTRTLGKVFTGAAVATTLLFGTVSAEAARPTCKVSSLDARLAVKADQGAAPLRQFVERTQTIHQLDVDGALVRADRARKTAAQCKVTTASR